MASGADAGALMREYFWTSMRALSIGKFMLQSPIFEGEDDHRIPNTDAVLIRSNVFSLVGKFMAHSALHTGIAFVGLAKPVFQYILTDKSLSESGLQIVIEDVADAEIREALKNVNWAPNLETTYLTDYSEFISD
jgi:hypothetical protein